tara:strand:+ start:146 stop:415 length:270 start_codon:yes stop_codon:yes gene_type:complete
LKIDQARVFTDMVVFHTQAALTTIEELLKSGKFNSVVTEVLENSAEDSLSVHERAVWETLKDLFDPEINPAAKDYHESLWGPDAEEKKH